MVPLEYTYWFPNGVSDISAGGEPLSAVDGSVKTLVSLEGHATLQLLFSYLQGGPHGGWLWATWRLSSPPLSPTLANLV